MLALAATVLVPAVILPFKAARSMEVSNSISGQQGGLSTVPAPAPRGVARVRELVENTRAVDVGRWRRDGVLPGVGMFACTWPGDGETVVNVYHEPGSVVLSYGYPTDEGAVEPVQERVEVVWVRCRFGGRRPFFICPAVVNGRACRRPVLRLYQGGRYFACRRCYGLAYTSQRQSAADRALARAQRIRVRLGGSASIMESFPPRPKWMRWRTYGRLCEEALDAEAEWERGTRRLLARAERLLAGIDADEMLARLPGLPRPHDRRRLVHGSACPQPARRR